MYALCGLRERKINILRETLAPGQCNYFSIHQNTLRPLKLNMLAVKIQTVGRGLFFSLLSNFYLQHG